MDIEILVNGEKRKVLGGTSVTTLIESLHLDQGRVAVEYNLKLLKRGEWGSTRLADGDRIEIVHFVGGGYKKIIPLNQMITINNETNT